MWTAHSRRGLWVTLRMWRGSVPGRRQLFVATGVVLDVVVDVEPLVEDPLPDNPLPEPLVPDAPLDDAAFSEPPSDPEDVPFFFVPPLREEDEPFASLRASLR